MSRVIGAIFENGVFKPLEPVDVKEREKVEIRVLSRDDWQKRFDGIIKGLQKKAIKYSSEEIEADAARAIKEVREEKRGR